MQELKVREYIHKLLNTTSKADEKRLRDEKLTDINLPLYKYCYVCENLARTNDTIDYNIENLENDLLYFQDPAKFNDPFDCYLGFSQNQLLKDLLVDEFRKKGQYSPTTKRIIDMLFDMPSKDESVKLLTADDISKESINMINQYFSDDPLHNYLINFLSDLSKNNSKLFLKIITGKSTILDRHKFTDLMFENAAFKKYFANNINGNYSESLLDIVKYDMQLKDEDCPNNSKDNTEGKVFSIIELLLDLSYLFKDYNLQHEDINNIKQEFDLKSHEALKQGRKIISDQFKITCLSERMDSPLMWAHYANKHFGFCLEYDFTSTLIGPRYPDLLSAQLMLFPVHYTETRPLLTKTIFNSKNILSYLKTKQIPKITFEKIMYELLSKSNEWDYEREWRILNISGKSTMRLPKPRKIFLGANIEDGAKQRIISIAKAKNIPIYQMFLSADRYKFDYYQLEI